MEVNNFADQGTPNGPLFELTLSDISQELVVNPAYQYTHVVVQCRANGETYTNTKEVAFYRVDNEAAAINSGYTLGDGDYRIFSKAEIKNGVTFISGEVGLTGLITAQAYFQAN
jgi:hypothetical protein